MKRLLPRSTHEIINFGHFLSFVQKSTKPVQLAEMRIVKFQVATNAVGPAGLVVACDLLPLEPVQGALVLAPRDFTLKDTQEEIR